MHPKAPRLDVDAWINTDPVSLRSLRGRAVVLVFWAVSCEASWERLRQLEVLRRDHPELAVVAVHSPRFEYERQASVVAEAVARRRIQLPVGHDPRLETWGHYGIEGRPSSVVVDHRGRVTGMVAGTDVFDVGDHAAITTGLVADRRRARVRDRSDHRDSPGSDLTATSMPTRDPHPGSLQSPSGIARLTTWEDGQAIVAVVDAGHRRILRVRITITGASLTAQVTHVVDHLQELGSVTAIDERRIAVSCPGDGTVEVIDTTSGRCDTIASGLVRPMGLCLDRDASLVACDAGGDQLFRISSDGTVGPIAGSGFSGHRDGRARTAELSQPVAVCRLEGGLLIAEAGSNGLRLLTDRGRVHTLVGTSGDARRVHAPGLVDGPVHRARLQRPTGLSTFDGRDAVVADLGNSRLRVLAGRRVSTLGVRGLARPEAVAHLSPHHLLIADTGNHRIVMVEPRRGRVETVRLDGLDAARAGSTDRRTTVSSPVA